MLMQAAKDDSIDSLILPWGDPVTASSRYEVLNHPNMDHGKLRCDYIDRRVAIDRYIFVAVV